MKVLLSRNILSENPFGYVCIWLVAPQMQVSGVGGFDKDSPRTLQPGLFIVVSRLRVAAFGRRHHETYHIHAPQRVAKTAESFTFNRSVVKAQFENVPDLSACTIALLFLSICQGGQIIRQDS